MRGIVHPHVQYPAEPLKTEISRSAVPIPRARRAAQRQGYQLVRNPRRDPRAIGYGAYRITDAGTGEVVASFGWDERPYTADRHAEAEAWLQGNGG